MRKVLTPDLISAKTRCDNLLLIKNLNLWGNDIEDIKLLRQMPNLEILSLSVNRISSLKEFANCKKLQELYLRKNNITDLEELRYLIDLQDLRILWLLDNPCSEQENYREIVINALPNIKKLDNNDVSNEERKLAEVIKRPINKNTDFGSNQQVKAMDYVSNNQQGKIIDSPKVIKTRASLYEEKPAAAIVKPRNSEFIKEKEFIKKNQEGNEQRKENVLCAVLALIKELDINELDFLKRDIDRKIGGGKQY